MLDGVYQLVFIAWGMAKADCNKNAAKRLVQMMHKHAKFTDRKSDALDGGLMANKKREIKKRGFEKP